MPVTWQFQGVKFFFLKTFFKAADIFRVYALPKQRRYRVQLRVYTCTVYRNKGLVTRTLTLFPRPPVVCLPVNENQAYVQYFQPVCSRAVPSLPRFCLRGGVHRLNNFNDSITDINRGIIPSIFQIWSALACCEKLAWELKGKQKQVNI